VPAAPSGLQALSAVEPVELDWNDNFEPDLAGYRVMRTLGPGEPYAPLQPGLLPSSLFTDVSVNSDSLYYYVVTAEDVGGDESLPSAPLAVPVGVTPWVNEIHHDNPDADEGVEIAGLAAIDLTGWQLMTYNGNGGGLRH
jgi:hypothetical protein